MILQLMRSEDRFFHLPSWALAAALPSSSCLFDTFVSVDGLRKRSGAITNWLRVNVNCMMMARLILRRSTKLSFSALPLKAQFPCSTGKQRKVCYDARIL